MDFEESDEGKRVVDQDGNKVGTITEVSDGKGHVETQGEESVLKAITSGLGWDDSAVQELQSDDVESTDENEVRIREL